MLKNRKHTIDVMFSRKLEDHKKILKSINKLHQTTSEFVSEAVHVNRLNRKNINVYIHECPIHDIQVNILIGVKQNKKLYTFFLTLMFWRGRLRYKLSGKYITYKKALRELRKYTNEVFRLPFRERK